MPTAPDRWNGPTLTKRRMRASLAAMALLGASIAHATCPGVSVSIDGICFHITAVHLPGFNGEIGGANDAGTVVGSYSNISAFSHPQLGFLQTKGGSVQTFSEPNAVSPSNTIPPLSLTQPSGINNSNQIVGWYNDTKSLLRGFILTGGVGGTYTTFDYFTSTVSGNGTVLRGLNNAGDMVGKTIGMPGGDVGFLITGGTKIPIVYQGLSTNPTSVNNFREVVGNAGVNTLVGFYRSPGGVLSALNYPGAKSTTPAAINDLGYVGGNYIDSSATPKSHGFVYDQLHNQYYSFDIPGSVATNVAHLNNGFEIWGNYITPAGDQFWYHLLPTVFDGGQTVR